jgi:hypothetical protein
MVEVCGSNVFYWNYYSILEINLYITAEALEHIPDLGLCKIYQNLLRL